MTSRRKDGIEERTLLSEREDDVLALLAKGARNREIACTLEISPHTVRHHVSTVLTVLGVKSRTAAAAQYWERDEAARAPKGQRKKRRTSVSVKSERIGVMSAVTTAMIGKLGKKAPKRDTRTLQLARYVDHAVLPNIPQHYSWAGAVQTWPMMLNDQLGDCTCAALGHQVQCWTANIGREDVLHDTDILGAYSAVSGYDIANASGDEGAYELDVLNYWQKTGVGGHSIDAFVALEPGNHEHLRLAIYVFGGAYIGLALPLSVQDQVDVWSVMGGDIGVPGSLGGHAVPLVGYDSLGVTCVTWGRLQKMTWAFMDSYCDEAYGVLSSGDWLGLSPSGLAIGALRDDLAALQSTMPPQPVPVAGA